MQNIDPIYILQPLIVIIICTAFLVYWRRKRRFHLMVLVYSLIAYAVAIALKYAVQIPTINIVINSFGAHSVELGLYYGLQTVFFEVGLAFVVVWYAFKHGAIEKKDAEGYGSGLAFWENAGLLGILSLINLVSYYGILSSNTSLAQTLYNQLQSNAPDLFAPASQALSLVAIGILERISSIMIHFAWGYLCVMAVVYNKKQLFLIALPMGLVDFLVPFAAGHVILFEGVVFALAVFSVLVAWYATKRVKQSVENQTASAAVSDSPSTQSLSLNRHK
jgi:hypothetical protein